jgi:predicted transcriptional regulator
MGCGQQQKTLKRHLSVAHGMTPQQYRSEFGLPASYPMVAPNYSATRREMAHRIGLGTKGAGGRKKAAASTPVPSKARHKTKKS